MRACLIFSAVHMHVSIVIRTISLFATRGAGGEVGGNLQRLLERDQ